MEEKVFGIGFHKTATTSLAVALYTLGYNVTGYFGVHDPEIGEKVYDIAFARADRFDAAQDSPWPLLYKELDRRYPGSKFVLTVRPPEKWIKSVARHFQDEEVALREWIYGVGAPAGNEEIYLERFRRHNREVKEYFQERPDDLLVMDITSGDGWNKLCAFLGVEEPPFAFPNMNTFRERNNLLERAARFLRRKLALPVGHGISAAAARDLIHYHYANFDKIWESVASLNEAQFATARSDAERSIRALLSEQLAEEMAWVRQLGQGTIIAEHLPPEQLPQSQEALHRRWQDNMQLMRLYVANLTDEDANARLESANASVWEVLLQLVSDGIKRQARLQPLLEARGVAPALPSFLEFFRGN